MANSPDTLLRITLKVAIPADTVTPDVCEQTANRLTSILAMQTAWDVESLAIQNMGPLTLDIE